MANWVLKFISGKYQGGEFPLEEGGEYHIGRSSESDMVLVEDMVSRNHARIRVVDDVVKLHDLGSTNGSFVNGERVGDVDLDEGDRILFGTSIIKLIRTSGEAASASSQLTSPAPEESVHGYKTQSFSQGTGVTMSGAMSGLLEEVSLPDLLQLFSTSRKSGCLKLMRETEKAQLYLRDGRVVYAEIEGVDMPPDKAAFRVMTWETGMFVLEPPSDRTFDEEIEMSTEAMMMEAMRLMDEMENIRHKLPDPGDPVRISQPLEPPLRSLTPELLDTLQLVVNSKTVADILDQSLASDLETMQDLEYLIKHKYVEVG